MNKSRVPFPWPLMRFWLARILPIWLGMALIIFLFQIAVCGIVHDNEKVKALLQMLDMLPSFIKSMLGGETLQLGNISALIAIGYQHPLVMILFMLYAVGVPNGLLAGEVQQGTMELILSRRVTKIQVYTCAALITMAGMFMMVIVMFLGTVAATHIYEFNPPVPLNCFFKTAVNAGLMASAVGGISLMLSAGLRRSVAMTVTIGYLVLMYFTDFIAEWWPWLSFLKPTTLFQYIGSYEIFALHRWPLQDMGVLAAVLVTTTVIGAIFWCRRDIAN